MKISKLYHTMRFIIKKNGVRNSRIGKLEISLTPEDTLEFETPFCFLYTEAGSVPHLTYEVLQKLTNTKLPMQLPLPNILDFEDSVAALDKGISYFVGLPEYPIYIPVQDPAKETQSGYNVKKSIAVWTTGGRNKITLERFMKLQENYRPNMYQSLCDSDTPKGCSNKRISHSVGRSIKMLDECLTMHKESKYLKNSAIFGTIQGGFDKDARKFSATETALRAVDGFVIEGFHCNAASAESLVFSEIQDLLDDVVSYLPPEKPRLMHSSHTPEFFINCILSGVDIFDSSYPYLVTERGCASVFQLSGKSQLCVTELQEISLEDMKYKEDFTPILDNCRCYACKNFTRAYINHLLVTSELLGSILLMLHNVHHFLEFFRKIREAIKAE